MAAALQMIQNSIAYVQAAGPIGYLLYILAYIVCCVALVPALTLTVAAGAIFGFVRGSLIVIVGATAGASVAFLLGRTVFRRHVERRVASNPKMAAVDRAIANEGTKIMLLMRLSGFPPFTWTNYALGLTGVKFLPYLLTTLFGIIPGTLAFTWAGVVGIEALRGRGHHVGLIVTAVGAVLVIIYVGRIAANAVKAAALPTLPTEDRGPRTEDKEER